jgi:hypothetical protein
MNPKSGVVNGTITGILLMDFKLLSDLKFSPKEGTSLAKLRTLEVRSDT